MVWRRLQKKYGAREILFFDVTLTLDAVPIAGQQLNADHLGCLKSMNPQNGTHGITNHANGQDMLLEHKQRQDAPPSPVPKRPGM